MPLALSGTQAHNQLLRYKPAHCVVRVAKSPVRCSLLHCNCIDLVNGQQLLQHSGCDTGWALHCSIMLPGPSCFWPAQHCRQHCCAENYPHNPYTNLLISAGRPSGHSVNAKQHRHCSCMYLISHDLPDCMQGLAASWPLSPCCLDRLLTHLNI